MLQSPHGWNDSAITPLSAIDCYTKAVAANGGEGPNTFDKLDVVIMWVEQGKAPDQVIASHATQGKVDRTRPLCPYPLVAKYQGSGSSDEAQNFSCAAP